MKNILLICTVLSLTFSACTTVKTTGKVIGTTGEVVKTTGKVAYKTGRVTGKTVIAAGKGSAAAIDKATSSDFIQDMTMSPQAANADRIGDKDSLGEVMLSPLSDLNLRKQRIPKKLTQLKSPYEPLPVTNCETLFAEIVSYDDILGPDVNSDRFEAKEARSERQTREAALDVAEAGVSSFIPFRGLVRAATGATQHENNIRQAYRAGMERRGYLRGLYDARGC